MEEEVKIIDTILFIKLIVVVFQGGWENDETVEEAAVREAIEEAGVRGELMVSFTSNLYVTLSLV